MDSAPLVNQAEESEGEENASPSVVGAPERPSVEGEVVDDDVVDAIADVLPVEDRASAVRLLRTYLEARSGPLPPPEELRQYVSIDPAIGHAILADFERRSEVWSESARNDIEINNRQMLYLEREQELRFEQSEADIATRNRVIIFGFSLLLLLLLAAFLIVVTAPPESQAARAWVAGALVTAITAIGIATLLRGRFGDKEGEVMINTLPSFSRNGQRHSRRRHEDVPALPPPDPGP